MFLSVCRRSIRLGRNSIVDGKKSSGQLPIVLSHVTLATHSLFIKIQTQASTYATNKPPHLEDTRSPRNHALFDTQSSFILHKRTRQIKHLCENDIGEEVVLHGYLGARVDLSKTISFVPLLSADLACSVQIVSLADSSSSTTCHSLLKAQTPHSPVTVRGFVARKEKPKKPRSSTGIPLNQDIEVKLSRLEVFNKFPADVTFKENTVISPEQRHLQLRQSNDLRQTLRLRAEAVRHCQNYLTEKWDFLEIETPLLFKSTPEGAREFIVPTRKKGHVYALPQSPQQYKQILMASGIAKYFQFAKCFRDEDLRADRQPEFTQLDMEMAFATGADVMNSVQDLIGGLWQKLLASSLPSTFPIMSFDDAMSQYGSDKPDLRLGMEIMRIGHLIPVDLVSKIGPLTNPTVEALKFSVSEDPHQSRTFMSEFMDSAEAHLFLQNPQGQPGIFVFDSRKPLSGLQAFGFEAAEQLEESLGLKEGDIVVIQARENAPFSGGSTMLGGLRLALHQAAVAKGKIPAPSGQCFLWVNDFPLFLPSDGTEPGQGGRAGLSSAHHPFTSPLTVEDVDLLATNPLAARADHYDLVLNGIELGGGSRRIHDPKLQEYVLRHVLKMTDERMKDFAHLLDVLASGCPPHAGFALGFDRLIAVMLGKQSIRDVIAFPKSGSGEDMLVKSPAPVTQEQLETYHLQLAP